MRTLDSRPVFQNGRPDLAELVGFLAASGLVFRPGLLHQDTSAGVSGGKYAVLGGFIWNIGLLLGLSAITLGLSDGEEWLEFPWQVDLLFVVGGALCSIPLLLTAANRQVEHLYVTSWYLMAALVWFPILFLIANLPFAFPGASGATVNWWFAHNVLGLWVTPIGIGIGIGIAYYMIPKILGKPIISYQLSLIGFWSLALFYSQVGIHAVDHAKDPG